MLEEGLKLKCVSSDNVYFEVENFLESKSKNVITVNSIEVVEQRGQMSMVPWAKVTLSDGVVCLVNLALASYVTLLEDTTIGEGHEPS